MHRARQLFAIAIETPGGLKVQTIHAFCERLLQRFPIEAGVPPGFVILDDHERDALLKQATDEMLAEATGAKTGALWPALQTAIAYAVNDGFDNVLKQALAELGRTRAPHGEDALAAIEAQLRATFRVRAGIGSEDLIGELSETFAEEMLPLLASALRAGSTTRPGSRRMPANRHHRRLAQPPRRGAGELLPHQQGAAQATSPPRRWRTPAAPWWSTLNARRTGSSPCTPSTRG